MQNAIARQNGKIISPYEFSYTNKLGQQLWGYLYADIFEYEGSPAIIGIVLDITERKQMEEYMLQASKLESIGILAGVSPTILTIFLPLSVVIYHWLK